MVMLVARDGQYPATNALAIDGFGFPRAVSLLGGGFVLGSHAFIRPTTSITDKITSDDVISRDVSTAHPGAMRPSLDNLIALLLHPPIEILDQLLVGAEDASMRHCNGLEDPKHGCQDALVRAVIARGRVDLKSDLCVSNVIRGVTARSRRGEEGCFGRRFGLNRGTWKP
jgi:hypothetical protein